MLEFFFFVDKRTLSAHRSRKCQMTDLVRTRGVKRSNSKITTLCGGRIHEVGFFRIQYYKIIISYWFDFVRGHS